MTRDTEKCPLSVLTGVHIKRVNFGEKVWAFCRDKRKCPYKAGVRRAGFHCHNKRYGSLCESYYVSLFRFSDFSGECGPRIAVAGVIGGKFK